jgi:hypothetical protein
MNTRKPIDHLYRSELLHVALVESRLGELRDIAQQDRLARQVRGPRPLRRRVGRLLIAAGQAVAGAPVPSPVVPGRVVVR